jgi:hypothetical protein
MGDDTKLMNSKAHDHAQLMPLMLRIHCAVFYSRLNTTFCLNLDSVMVLYRIQNQ